VQFCLEQLAPKWPILRRAGCWTLLTHSLNPDHFRPLFFNFLALQTLVIMHFKVIYNQDPALQRLLSLCCSRSVMWCQLVTSVVSICVVAGYFCHVVIYCCKYCKLRSHCRVLTAHGFCTCMNTLPSCVSFEMGRYCLVLAVDRALKKFHSSSCSRQKIRNGSDGKKF